MFAQSHIKCQIADSLRLIRWRKSVWNVPFNGLSVAAASGTVGATTADVLGDFALEARARALMCEVITAARAECCAIADDFVEDNFERTRKMGAYKSSMQVDFESGRPLEIEAIIGEPVRRALASGIAAPELQALYEQLSKIEMTRGFQ